MTIKESKIMRTDTPNTYQGWKILSPQKAKSIAGKLRLPRMGYEIKVGEYWLANVSGCYVFKRYDDPNFDLLGLCRRVGQ